MIDQLRKKLKHYNPQEIGSEPNVRAAVVIPLYRKDEGYSLILIKRTASVKSHPGEVSFPGGMFEPTDGDSKTTALRECCEEIGVREEDIEVIGRLDDERTLTGFVITPFVGVIPFPYPFSLSEHEVAYLIHLPLAFLAATEPVIEQVKYDGEVKGIHTLYYRGERIWGATCRLLIKLKGVMGE